MNCHFTAALYLPVHSGYETCEEGGCDIRTHPSFCSKYLQTNDFVAECGELLPKKSTAATDYRSENTGAVIGESNCWRIVNAVLLTGRHYRHYNRKLGEGTFFFI